LKRIIGVRHKCLACPDWDYCWSCIKDAPRTHPGHRFVPIYGAIAEHPVHSEIHRGIFCDGPLCKNKRIPAYITGVRYKCSVCYDTDFCEACETLPTNPHNPTHPLIKFKTSIQGVTVTTYNDSGLGGPIATLGDVPAPVPAPANTLVPAPEPVLTPMEAPPAQSVSNSASPADQPERQTEEVMRSQLQELTEEFTKMVDENAEKERQQPPDFESADDETKSAVMMASARASGYQAHFIRDAMPDGSKLPPNHVFQQTWTLYNPGPLPWIPGSSVRFVGGDSMFNVDTDRPSSIASITAAMESNVLSDMIMPGEKADFSVTLKTPQREGTAISYWRLKHPDGTPFGHKLWCDIQVRMDATESVKDEPAESTDDKASETTKTQHQGAQTEVKQELQLTDSVMVFPKLEKESPLSRSEVAPPDPAPVAPSAPSLSNVDEQDILEDVESLALEDVDSADGFLTDEEYDILDASDQEFFNARGSHQ
jgi:next to BRCA1 gene 1 protein